MVLLSWVLVMGVSCTRWRKDRSDPDCCDDADTCLAVLQAVKGADPGVEQEGLSQEQSCAVIQASQQGPSLIPRLIPLLDHADSRVRNGAALALGLMGQFGERREKAIRAVPVLIAAAEREPRGKALRALLFIDDVRALPFLRRQIADLPGSTFAEVGPNVAGMMLEVLEDPSTSQKELIHIHDAVTQGDPRSLGDRRFEIDDALLFPRLRALLKRELDEPVLRRPPDAVCPAVPAWTCTPIFDGCTPRAAYVVSLIQSFMRRPREEAWEEVRQAFLRGDPRLTPVALDALAHFQSPEAVKPLIQELSIQDCQLHAMKGLRKVGPVARSEAMAPLIELLESDAEGWLRVLAADLIADLGEEEAYGPLLRALEANHSGVQAVAVNDLRRPAFRKYASELIPRLEKQEEESSSPAVRQAAWNTVFWFQLGERETEEEETIAAYERIEALDAERKAGRVSPSRWRCPTLAPKEGGLEIQDRNEALFLRHLWERESIPEAQGACSGVPDLEMASIIAPLGEGCLVGHNNGEFGGSLSFYEKGERKVLEWMNPDRLLKVHGDVVVLSSLSHLFLREGELFRIERTASGPWRAVPWVTLPGSPLAYGYDREGNLVLATDSPPAMTYDVNWDGAGCSREVVRITRDGQAISVEAQGPTP